MLNWDYDIPKNWQPKTDTEWEWYLTRVINYGLHGERLKPEFLIKYLDKLKIEPKTKEFLRLLLAEYEYNNINRTANNIPK